MSQPALRGHAMSVSRVRINRKTKTVAECECGWGYTAKREDEVEGQIRKHLTGRVITFYKGGGPETSDKRPVTFTDPPLHKMAQRP